MATQTPEQLDQNVVAMMRALREHESGNKAVLPQEKGIGGASIYQYTTSTWKGVAEKYLGDANAPLNRANENKATYYRIKDWKDKGFKPAQIASMWNAGENEPDAYTGKFSNGKPSVGVNSYGVKYDVPAHAKSVLAKFQAEVAKIPKPAAAPVQAQPTVEQPPEKKGFLAKTADVINKGYEAYTQLPPVKKLAENVGRATEILGGAAGELYGGLGETAVQTYKAAKGEGFDTESIKKYSKETGQELAGLSKQVGETAGPASLLGGAGRLVNLALAGGMGYSGYDTFKQGYEQKDYVKMYEGLQNMVVAGLGAKEGFAKGEKGLLVDPKVKSQIKAEIDYIKGNTPETHIQKATEAYREILNPTKGEIKKAEIKQKGDIDEPYRRMAEKGLVIEKDVNNKLDTTKAVETLNEGIKKNEDVLQSELSKRPNEVIDLEQVRFNAKKSIDKQKNVSADEKAAQKAEVDKLIDSEITARKTSRQTKNREAVTKPSLVESNQIKRGMWGATKFDATRPYRGTASYEIGKAMSEQIVQRAPETAPINLEMGKDIQTRRLLEDAHGRGVKGGKIGNYAAGMAGTIIGSTVNVPVVGPLLGKIGAETMQSYLTDPYRITTGLQKKGSNLTKTKNQSFLKNVGKEYENATKPFLSKK